MDTELTQSVASPSTPSLMSGLRSSFKFTLHFTQLLNKSIKQGGNSSGINEHF